MAFELHQFLFIFLRKNLNKMNLHKYITHSSICFRRWRRKGYAIFCSLSRVVCIGHLSIEMLKYSSGSQKNTFLLQKSTFEFINYYINIQLIIHHFCIKFVTRISHIFNPNFSINKLTINPLCL